MRENENKNFLLIILNTEILMRMDPASYTDKT